jgi:hypothetical protein
MALHPPQLYCMNPQVRPAWSKIRHLFVNFFNPWNFMAAVLGGLFPALQTVTVKHAHFPGGYRAMRYARMNDQDVHEMIRSDPIISWKSHTTTFWRLVEMEKTFSVHISIGSRQEEDGTMIVSATWRYIFFWLRLSRADDANAGLSHRRRCPYG